MPMHPQTAIQMGQLLQRLAGNPKTRAKTLGLVKEIDPNYRLPADVAIEALEQRQKAEREKERQDNAKANRERRMADQRKKLLESGQYDEDRIKEIETTVMKKYPALDYDDAVKLYAAETSPATPSNRRDQHLRHGQHWEFPNIPGLLENPDKAATDMAYAVIDELRGRA